MNGTRRDAKLSKYAVGKKSATGDRVSFELDVFASPWVPLIDTSTQPVTRRPEAPVALGLDGYERLPFAIAVMISPEHRIQQRTTVLPFLLSPNKQL